MTSSNRMIARHSKKEDGDDFPTPPWATRALFEYSSFHLRGTKSVWEPAAGRGHMFRVLQGRFRHAYASDIADYGMGVPLWDFTDPKGDKPERPIDWVITNPPYKHAEEFFHRACSVARVGIALLVRINWLQNGGRYERIFRQNAPSAILQFAGRMPAAQGKVIRGPAGFFQHCWVVWRHLDNEVPVHTFYWWIPPDAQAKLERDEDY